MKYGNADYLRKLTHKQLTAPNFFVNEVLGGRKLNMPTHEDFGIITSRIVEGMNADTKFFKKGPQPIIKAIADFTHALFLSRVEAVEKLEPFLTRGEMALMKLADKRE